MQIVTFCDRAITYLFYALFFFVPLVFVPVNYELFEFNKMIFTYLMTIVIGFFWAVNMVLQRKIIFRRTPLDIPIALFLLSQILATITSIDMHTSVWGYYSRSNGGLASLLSYIFLYYAFVTNMSVRELKRLLLLALLSGILVAVYGVLERLGIDKDFWVQDVQNRVFSTLGQPNWLAAYLSILIPLSLTFGLQTFIPPTKSDKKYQASKRPKLLFALYFILSSLYYLTLLFTKSRSGFVGFGIGLLFFAIMAKISNSKSKSLLIGIIFLGITFIFGTPFEQLNRFTLDGIRSQLHPSSFILHPSDKPQGPALEVGGTESGDIRKIVWKGAIAIAKANPLFGTGVETFAYSYYKYRPVEHNKTSEWDFLYNKAHNEYLNYLANTGFIGLGTYLLMILTFMVLSIRYLVLSIRKKMPNTAYFILTSALVSAYTSILVSNFFGFSVVVTNLYLFLIPAFVLVLLGLVETKSSDSQSQPVSLESGLSIPQWIGLVVLLVTSYLLLVYIFRMWDADRNFALGESLDKSGEYVSAHPYLRAAILKRPGEPFFSEELSTAASALAIAAVEQEESTLSAQLVDEAVKQSDYTVKKSPNNPSFWRTRIHVLFTLSQLDPKYLEDALSAAKRAAELAPTDPKIAYNYALILGQSEKIDEAVRELERAVALKPDYRDPVYALGLFYHEKATDDKGRIVNQEFFDKAVKQMENVLKLASDGAEAKARLKEWRGF